jgi:hypothetical protein
VTDRLDKTPGVNVMHGSAGIVKGLAVVVGEERFDELDLAGVGLHIVDVVDPVPKYLSQKSLSPASYDKHVAGAWMLAQPEMGQRDERVGVGEIGCHLPVTVQCELLSPSADGEVLILGFRFGAKLIARRDIAPATLHELSVQRITGENGRAQCRHGEYGKRDSPKPQAKRSPDVRWDPLCPLSDRVSLCDRLFSQSHPAT